MRKLSQRKPADWHLMYSLELSHQLRDSDAKLVLAGAGQLATALKAATTCGLDSKKVFLLVDPAAKVPKLLAAEQAATWMEIWAPYEDARQWTWKTITTKREAQETTAVINYSSG